MLLSLLIALGLLGLIVGISLWYQAYSGSAIDAKVMIITDAIGFLVMYGIVYHFLKPIDEQQKW